MKKKDCAGQSELFPTINTPWGRMNAPVGKVNPAKQEPVSTDSSAIVQSDVQPTAVQNDGYGDRPCYACGDETTNGLCTGHQREFGLIR